ncbi:uncharacterized protein LY79DRAFT_357355 [Colletotrichum navitas]|uniref:Uncharacterized protein n=1 Tax=Colletotrichum navitas TaxID=681940 RepID=A0AAD8PRX7_9PEZI|nr:uncharacterized protein LY79DRAFT_357355 [Colletotrichum navitas]KAK1579132.1 hypothetical protein LY79DRAFT_357355 [Colletotrichum navitas]
MDADVDVVRGREHCPPSIDIKHITTTVTTTTTPHTSVTASWFCMLFCNPISHAVTCMAMLNIPYAMTAANTISSSSLRIRTFDTAPSVPCVHPHRTASRRAATLPRPLVLVYMRFAGVSLCVRTAFRLLPRPTESPSPPCIPRSDACDGGDGIKHKVLVYWQRTRTN